MKVKYNPRKLTIKNIGNRRLSSPTYLPLFMNDEQRQRMELFFKLYRVFRKHSAAQMWVKYGFNTTHMTVNRQADGDYILNSFLENCDIPELSDLIVKLKPEVIDTIIGSSIALLSKCRYVADENELLEVIGEINEHHEYIVMSYHIGDKYTPAIYGDGDRTSKYISTDESSAQYIDWYQNIGHKIYSDNINRYTGIFDKFDRKMSYHINIYPVGVFTTLSPNQLDVPHMAPANIQHYIIGRYNDQYYIEVNQYCDISMPTINMLNKLAGSGRQRCIIVQPIIRNNGSVKLRLFWLDDKDELMNKSIVMKKDIIEMYRHIFNELTPNSRLISGEIFQKYLNHSKDIRYLNRYGAYIVNTLSYMHLFKSIMVGELRNTFTYSEFVVNKPILSKNISNSDFYTDIVDDIFRQLSEFMRLLRTNVHMGPNSIIVNHKYPLLEARVNRLLGNIYRRSDFNWNQ